MNPKSNTVSNGAAKKNKKKSISSVKRFIFTVAKIVIIFLLVLSFATAGILGGAVLGYIKTASPVKEEDLLITNLTTFIYDANGTEMKQLTGKDNVDREWVPYDEIPKYLEEAFISVEDMRFMSHHGVDFQGILRAVQRKILSPSSKMEGGSTITQQVVRNITGQTKVSLQRKVQEWYQAWDFERRFNKWQIIEFYSNLIYFGNSYYGVRSASKAYFGKDVTELSLAECALLAGVTNSPGKYNLFTDKGRAAAKTRQEVILKLMLDQRKIDQKEYDQALKENITFYDKGETQKSTGTHSYFIDQVINDVRDDLMEKKGMSKTMASAIIFGGGLKIKTTMDPDVQNALDEVFLDEKYYIGVEEKTKRLLEHPEAGMVIVDPETGEVKGMRGGFGEKKASMTLNRATQIERQPGSSFKPIAVYGPAIDQQKITPATIIDDKPVYFGSGKDKNRPYPKNYDHKYSGLMTIRNAIKRSINVVAATVWMGIPDTSLAYLKKSGIDRDNERYLSIALGAPSKGVSPLQMAAAYVPFVHKGMYFEPTTYTEVYDSKGKLLLEKKPEYHPVYSEEAAFLMVDMMKEVVSPGGTAASRGVIKNGQGKVIPTAGKTGTTSDNKDKWFVGYSPYYVAATWYGYDHPRELLGNERSQALIIWHDVMEKIHGNKDVVDFPQPQGLVKKTICIYSGKIATELCARDPRGSAVREEYFIKGTEPKDYDTCDVHVLAKVCLDCKDAWGKNLLAGPYCPPQSVAEKVFIQRPEPYVPVSIDETPPNDWKLYELPAGEYCTIHGEPKNQPDLEGIISPHVNGKNNDDLIDNEEIEFLDDNE